MRNFANSGHHTGGEQVKDEWQRWNDETDTESSGKVS